MFCLQLLLGVLAVSLTTSRQVGRRVPLDIFARGFDISPALRNYIHLKADRVDYKLNINKYLIHSKMFEKLGDDVTHAHITLELIGPSEPELNLHTHRPRAKTSTVLLQMKGGTVLKSTESSDQMHTSVDNSLHSSARALARYHSRMKSRQGWRGAVSSEDEALVDESVFSNDDYDYSLEDRPMKLSRQRLFVNATESSTEPARDKFLSKVKRTSARFLQSLKEYFRHRWVSVLIFASMLLLSYGSLSYL